MLFKTYLTRVVTIFTIISLTEGFNVRRMNEIEVEVDRAFEVNKDMKAVGERISQHSDPKLKKMNEKQQKVFLADYKQLEELFGKMGEDFGNGIATGSSDEQILAQFDNLRKQEQSKKYYKRLGKIAGRKNLKDLFKITRNRYKQLIVTLREKKLIQK